ncbi:MAG: DNA polymerase Y family protein [bacterium]|nr:DNA polymerase Y family protein [bacterium]
MKTRFLSLYTPHILGDLIRKKLQNKRNAGKKSHERYSNDIKQELAVSTPQIFIILVEKHGNKELVARCCSNAATFGVRPGISVIQAADLCSQSKNKSEILINKFNENLENKTLQHLASWAYRFSPRIAIDLNKSAPAYKSQLFSGISLDITGTSRIFPSEDSLITAIVSELEQYGISARLAITPTSPSAWAFSRYGENKTSIIEDNELKYLAQQLPCEALGLSEPINQEMKEVNITRLGHLFDLPQRIIAERFGLQTYQQIRFFLGEEKTNISQWKFDNLPTVEKSFLSPISNRLQLIRACEELLPTLITKLQLKQCCLSAIEISISSTAKNLCQQITISPASNSKKYISAVIKATLERMTLPEECHNLKLTVSKSVSAIAWQFNIAGENENLITTKAEIVGSLSAIVGANNTLLAVGKESYLPEQVTTYIPAISALGSRPAKSKILAADRPSRLFPQAQKITVLSLLPDNTPFLIRWSRKKYRIIDVIGPERITSEWWRNTEIETRDYFKAQIETGLYLWIFRAIERNQWFCHGVWC